MPRRLKLTPLQRDVLLTIEEAGSENLGTIIATLKPAEREFAAQLDALSTLGLIRKDGDAVLLTKSFGLRYASEGFRYRAQRKFRMANFTVRTVGTLIRRCCRWSGTRRHRID
jgi:hypothetical protein